MEFRRRSLVMSEGLAFGTTSEEEPVGRPNETLFMVSSKLPLITNWIKKGEQPSGKYNTVIQLDKMPYDLEVLECNFRLCGYKRASADAFKGTVKYVGLVDEDAYINGLDQEAATEAKETIVNRLNEEHNCIPIFISKSQLSDFHTFCKRVLWPIFHSLPVKEALSNEGEWKAYCDVSTAIAEVMRNFVKTDDYVWIHDYHFLVLPDRLKERTRDVRIGLFLHTPFPTIEMFRMLPMRQELLSALLEADLVSFQNFDYMRHFFRCCVRILGYDISSKGVECRPTGHTVSVKALPIGVDSDFFKPTPESEEFQQYLQEKYKDKKVLFSCDTLEPIKGVPLKFKAFEKFLTMYPEWLGKVVLVQLITPPNIGYCSHVPHPVTRIHSDKHKTSEAEPQSPSKRLKVPKFTINDYSSQQTLTYNSSSPYSRLPKSSSNVFTKPSSPPPQTFQHSPFKNHSNSPSLNSSASNVPTASESQMPPSIEDDIYERPYAGGKEEYEMLESQVNDLAARINSRFGDLHWQPIQCYFHHVTEDELKAFFSHADAALITPLRDGMNLTSFEFVLCQQEKKSPLILSEFCGSARCLSGAIHVNPWYLEGVASGINSAILMEDEEKAIRHATLYNYVHSHDAKRWSRDFLSELRQAAEVSEQQATKPIDIELLKKCYANSTRRAFFLDYDGTLAPLVRHPSLAAPNARLLSCLRKLAQDEKNQVSVLSGRDRDSLNNWLSGIPNLNLFAEHGSFQKLKNSSNWEFAYPNLDISWHEVVLPILKYWEARTPGSFIEYKQVNLVWHYRQADLEYGEWQARELKSQLDENIVSRGLPVEILSGKKAIEVRPHGFHKGTAVRRILSENDYDFVLVIGDDVTDEDMFVACDSITEAKKADRRSEESQDGQSDGHDSPSKAGSSSSSLTIEENPTSFTIVVGRHDSKAKWSVDSQRHVLDLLMGLN